MIPKERYQDVMTANQAVAIAAVRAKPKVIAAYPVTPQTSIVEHLACFVAHGDLESEYVRAESEHSAMSIVAAAQGTGVRTFTATASQGLAYMHEVVSACGGMRLPICMFVANRTLMSPGGIWPELSDSMPERDAAWIQIYVEDNQEAFDMILQAYKIAEDSRVLLPIMVCGDGYILTHSSERVEILGEKEIDDFLPPYKPEHAYLDVDRPMAQGLIVPPEFHMEAKWQMHQSMLRALDVIQEVNDEFAEKFSRNYEGPIEKYRVDDAEKVLVTIGSTTGTAREVVDELRKKGEKVGLVKLRVFRPFPKKKIKEALKHVQSIGVFDRSISYGSAGQCFLEIRNAMYGTQMPILNFIAGLGGRDVQDKDIKFMFDKLKETEILEEVIDPVVFVNTRGVTS